MRYRHVCWESLGYVLPAEVVTSAALEAQLAPVYQRLKLPEGRLELMTGIRERRFWPPGTLPSQMSIESGRRALAAAGVAPDEIGALVHGSVCRDHLEPATASIVHHGLELPRDCQSYDVSNACLGFLNGVLQLANLIELGQIRAGLVVASEGSREVVENTIRQLNGDLSLTRQEIKLAVASLTLGSASVAAVLTHRDLSRTGNRLHGGVVRAVSEHHALCQSGRDDAAAHDMRPLMRTDSEALLTAGVAAARDTFADFAAGAGWSREEIDRTICHQVGSAHRRLLLEALGLDEGRDFATFEWLGNTGAAALPVSLAVAAERGVMTPGERLALMGIGSGINVVMLAVEWQRSLVRSDPVEQGPVARPSAEPAAPRPRTRAPRLETA